MAIHRLEALTDTLVGHLFELGNTPFRLGAFRDRWAAFGWSHEPESSDEFGFQVKVSERLSLAVDPLGKRVNGASLPFLYWQDHDPEPHPDRSTYEQERRTYDAEFSAAARVARRVLGAPDADWRDHDDAGHQATVWECRHGLLILQQACFDPQFGIELNVWLEGCSIKDFTPTPPLIDWLGRRSYQLHHEHGFPPLDWTVG